MTGGAKKGMIITVTALAVLYGVVCSALFWAMSQPPDEFGQIMKHVPLPAMMILPFEPLWNVARAGALEVGAVAPDFELPTHDKSAVVRLGEFRGKSPVVLVFGSYT